MRLLAAIEAAFQAQRSSSGLLSAFQQWKTSHPSLARFEDIEELVSWYREAELEDRAVSTPVLTALCKQARTGDQEAALLLLWLLLPLTWWASGDPDYAVLDSDDIDAELVAGLWEAAVTIAQPDRQAGAKEVVSELIDSGRRRALAASQQSGQWELQREELTESTPASPDCPANAAQFVERAREQGVITQIEADLIVSTRLERRPVVEAGKSHGLSREAARSRRDRAELRLLAWMAGEPLPSRHLHMAGRALLTSLLDQQDGIGSDPPRRGKEVETTRRSAREQSDDGRERAP